MNTFHDPAKKPSINSLLNPEAASTFPVQLPPLNPNHHAPHPMHYHPHPPSFNLRAASWDNSPQVSKRSDESASAHRYYHHAQMALPEMHSNNNTYPAPRDSRSGMEEAQRYAVPSPVWPQPPHSNPYNTHNGAPVYPEQRIAISGDYQSHNSYYQSYRQGPYNAPPPPESETEMWQQAERASVRLVARAQQEPQPPHLQEARYSSYYENTPPTLAPIAYHQPPHAQHHHLAAPLAAPPQSQPQSEVSYNQPASSKRPLSDPAAPAPAKKKPRAKKAPVAGEDVSSAPGPSRRGYNAKKRSEAAHIAAQNASLTPTKVYVLNNDKGKGKATDARPQITSEEGNQNSNGGESGGNTQSLHPELQFARCMSNRYRADVFPRCVSCTRRWAGDTCRFQGIRFFLKDRIRGIVGISFLESQKEDEPVVKFPSKWNAPLKPEHVAFTKKIIARAMLPTLYKELDHFNIGGVIRRPREIDVRATCDTCMTSIFSASWMCRLCGREACNDCFVQVRELTIDRPGADLDESAALQAKRERHQHRNPFFLSCTKRNEHHANDFSPMTRFVGRELNEAIAKMEKLINEESREVNVENGTAVNDTAVTINDSSIVSQGAAAATESTTSGAILVASSSGSNPSADSSTSAQLTSLPPVSGSSAPVAVNGFSAPVTVNDIHDAPKTLDPSFEPLGLADPPFIPSNLSEITSSVPYLEIRRYSDAELSDINTPEKFAHIWAIGQPLVVTGVLPKFKLQWTPEYFREKHGDQTCLIVECQTDLNKRITVGEFFGWFGNYENRTECWKLKDWPPSTDFKSAFPELYADFSQAVPMPDYVRRDGVYNIGSHFPHNTIAPDLGPKMYNSMASNMLPGSKGSTKLHMDMADALNVMTYAATCPDGSPGCAAWDLFRAEDSDKLRAFLRKRFGNGGPTDPIHSQHFYLDEQARAALWNEAGVKSYRVYQRPGEAIFIPAGCAHQVANLSDCIKIAIDFVSPENVGRCEKLTREFRQQNQSMVWKEDVLQLRTMMWFAWLSCCHQEKNVFAV